jgi:hypothetical protein
VEKTARESDVGDDTDHVDDESRVAELDGGDAGNEDAVRRVLLLRARDGAGDAGFDFGPGRPHALEALAANTRGDGGRFEGEVGEGISDALAAAERDGDDFVGVVNRDVALRIALSGSVFSKINRCCL